MDPNPLPVPHPNNIPAHPSTARAGSGREEAADARSGMVLANTKVAALQPTVCAAWLQAWMSMRYSVKWRSRDSTALSRTTLSSKIWK